MRHESLPVVIIGAGPVGLAAAAHALSRNLTPLVLEAGPSSARASGSGDMCGCSRRGNSTSIRRRQRSSRDRAGRCRTERSYPTGHDLVDRYLAPLSHASELRPHIRTNSRVAGVARQGHDLMKDAARSEAPFVVRVVGPDGEEDVLAQAVIDASGTIEKPGALGASGVPALGERAAVRPNLLRHARRPRRSA